MFFPIGERRHLAVGVLSDGAFSASTVSVTVSFPDHCIAVRFYSPHPSPY